MTAGRRNTGTKKDWGTPPKYVEAVRRVFGGGIGLDPCSSRHSIVDAGRSIMPPEDGLKDAWDEGTIYVNPPYGADRASGTRIADWLARCSKAAAAGSQVLALVPVATNTRHWKRHVFGSADAVCFLSDTRLRFLVDGREAGSGAPMACAMVYWGQHYSRFQSVFSKLGAVVDVRPLKWD